MRTVLATGRVRRLALVAAIVAALVGACGTGTDEGEDARGSIVVTTSILGDVVANLVGDAVDVEVLMPAGSNPHEFAPSPRQVASMRAADVLVVNGQGFEAGLVDTVEAAASDGTTVVTASDAVELLPLAGADRAETLDPHFFTDPVRMAAAASALSEALATHVDGLDTPAYRARVASYLDELRSLDAEVAALLAVVAPDRRTLVTNHEVFGYFADRYGFQVLGAVIPGGSTLAEPSAAEMRDLADAIATARVPAIFVESSSPARLAEALAAEGTQVQVVELFAESLGEPGTEADTYVEMVRANARRIAAALG